MVAPRRRSPNKGHNGIPQVSTRGNQISEAIQYLDYLLASGLAPMDAWTKAGRIVIQHAEKEPLATLSVSEHTARMPKTSSVAEEAPMPSGDGFVQVIARGLIRWRTKKGFETVQDATDDLKVSYQNWYRIEKADRPGTTHRQLPTILKKIGLTEPQLYELGKAK